MNNRALNAFILGVQKGIVKNGSQELAKALGFANKMSLLKSYYFTFDVYYDPAYYTEIPVNLVDVVREADSTYESASSPTYLSKKSPTAKRVTREEIMYPAKVKLARGSFYKTYLYFQETSPNYLAIQLLSTFRPEESFEKMRIAAIKLLRNIIPLAFIGPLNTVISEGVDAANPKSQELISSHLRSIICLAEAIVTELDLSKLGSAEWTEADYIKLSMIKDKYDELMPGIDEDFMYFRVRKPSSLLPGLLMDCHTRFTYMLNLLIQVASPNFSTYSVFYVDLCERLGELAGSSLALLQYTPDHVKELNAGIEHLVKTVARETDVYDRRAILDFIRTLGLGLALEDVVRSVGQDIKNPEEIEALIRRRLVVCSNKIAAISGVDTIATPGEVAREALRRADQPEDIMLIIEDTIQDCLSFYESN